MARQKGPCTGPVLRRPLLWLAGLPSVSIPPSRTDARAEKQPSDLLLLCLLAHCRCTVHFFFREYTLPVADEGSQRPPSPAPRRPTAAIPPRQGERKDPAVTAALSHLSMRRTLGPKPFFSRMVFSISSVNTVLSNSPQPADEESPKQSLL